MERVNFEHGSGVSAFFFRMESIFLLLSSTLSKVKSNLLIFGTEHGEEILAIRDLIKVGFRDYYYYHSALLEDLDLLSFGVGRGSLR